MVLIKGRYGDLSRVGRIMGEGVCDGNVVWGRWKVKGAKGESRVGEAVAGPESCPRAYEGSGRARRGLMPIGRSLSSIGMGASNRSVFPTCFSRGIRTY